MVGCSLDGQADGDAIRSDDWLVLWLTGLTAGVVAVSLVASCQLEWLTGREAVCLVGCRLVGKLSAWMACWWRGCLPCWL